MKLLSGKTLASYAAFSRNRRTINSFASRAAGSANAICAIGTFSSLPAYAPTNVGSSAEGRCG